MKNATIITLASLLPLPSPQITPARAAVAATQGSGSLKIATLHPSRALGTTPRVRDNTFAYPPPDPNTNVRKGN